MQILDILQEAGLGDDVALRMCEELLLPVGSPGTVGDQDKRASDAESRDLVSPRHCGHTADISMLWGMQLYEVLSLNSPAALLH